MDWGDVGKKLADMGLPLLGAAMPIPGGAALGRALAGFITGGQSVSPGDAMAALNDPVAQEKAREFYTQNQTLILQATMQAETAQITAINETMRAEAGASNWPTFTWRPFLGFVFGIMVLGDYFILPLLHISPPTIPSEMWVAFMSVLGVASWGHSMAVKDPNNTAITKG